MVKSSMCQKCLQMEFANLNKNMQIMMKLKKYTKHIVMNFHQIIIIGVINFEYCKNMDN
jgi:hypothetical protein